MNAKLPTKLAKEPLLDAVFEVRFAQADQLASILPGFFFGRLRGGVTGVESLPASQMPKVIRERDPTQQLANAPLIRVHWGQYAILIGDSSVAIACKLPYPGWAMFRPAIEEVLQATVDSKRTGEVQRYSLKYVDMLKTSAELPASAQVRWSLKLGDLELRDENIVLRVEIPRDGFLHAISIATRADAQLESGVLISGAVLDVDTIQQDAAALSSLFVKAPAQLDAIHQSNKEVFFGCLSPSGLTALEPVYE